MPYLLCSMFMLASLSGCFGEENNNDLPNISSLEISPELWQAGMWNRVTFKALEPMNVFIPHFMLDTSTQFIQNGTILSLEKNEVVELEILPSARLQSAPIMISAIEEKQFPLRDANESWSTWFVRTGGQGT
ncbi:MAG: hypothetical protein VW270_11760, partial [Candidatus Poseidoniales archaeon]